MHLYNSHVPSGNAYKVELLLSHLRIPYTTTSLWILPPNSETHTPEFLALNPDGHVPVLVLDDGTPLTESNAIMFYLAEGTNYLPDDKIGKAQALKWLFFEQFSHEPYVAKFKFRTYWAPHGFSDLSDDGIKQMKDKGQAALDIMERHLEGKRWFVGDRYSIADIGLHVYTMTAEQTGFTVGPNVKAWLERITLTDGWVRIAKDPTGRNPY
jgi:glutathione S-transferase